jgi:hypothetical protein
MNKLERALGLRALNEVKAAINPTSNAYSLERATAFLEVATEIMANAGVDEQPVLADTEHSSVTGAAGATIALSHMWNALRELEIRLNIAWPKLGAQDQYSIGRTLEDMERTIQRMCFPRRD